MRILCLHGTGTNGTILKSQTVGFRSLLPDDWIWHYVDGEEEIGAARGIEAVFPGPYLCYFYDPSVDNVQEVLSLVYEAIDEEGPFDAVLGFSQGASVAASIILQHQLEKPFEPPLFRFAIFLCASLPFSWTDDNGFDVTPLVTSGQVGTADFNAWQRATMKEPSLDEETLNDIPPQMREQVRVKMQALIDKNATVSKYRRFHSEATTERIKIPTVHVHGVKDESREQSLALVDLCDSRVAQVVKHDEGHEVPRAASQNIANAIQQAVTRAEFAF